MVVEAFKCLVLPANPAAFDADTPKAHHAGRAHQPFNKGDVDWQVPVIDFVEVELLLEALLPPPPFCGSGQLENFRRMQNPHATDDKMLSTFAALVGIASEQRKRLFLRSRLLALLGFKCAAVLPHLWTR